MKQEIKNGVYWVGVVDWNIRHFHGYTYSTRRGTTYNAYLVLDDKVALVDTVEAGFSEDLVRHIRELIDPARIDYLVANHAEPDHSGAIPRILKLAPNATLVYSRKGADSFGKYYPAHDKTMIVKTGDSISLGHKTLQFIEAPMLHWPDSMFTYIPEDALLLPNDAFGQHLASSYRFADEVPEQLVWDEATAYYANILTPFGPLVLRKVEELQKLGLKIDTIAPSHGLIWRKDPLRIVQQYARWASGEAGPKVVIAYETMWGATDRLAQAIAEGIVGEGLEAQIFHAPETDHTDIITHILGARGVIFGSSTHNQYMLPHIASLIHEVKGLKFPKKLGAAFGLKGWAGGSVPEIERELKEAGIEVAMEGLAALKWHLSDDEWETGVEFGRAFANKVKASLQ